MAGNEIEVVSFYKYLGFYFTPKLVWTRTKDVLARQAKKATYSIFGFQKLFGHFSPADAFKLFDTMIKPIACYGAEIWGYGYSDEIEKIQTIFCKRYIGLKSNTMDRICPAYDEIRIQYFLPHWRQNITLHHFYNIMKLQSDDSIYAVSKFLISSFSLRNTYYPN